MEREVYELRQSLDRVTTVLDHLMERGTDFEPPHKRLAVQRKQMNQENTDASDIASQGLLHLAGQWVPRDTQGTNGTTRYPNDNSSEVDEGLVSPTLRSSESNLTSANIISENFCSEGRGDVLDCGVVTIEEAVNLFLLYFRVLDPHVCHLVASVHGVQEDFDFNGTSTDAPSQEVRCIMLLAIESIRKSSKLLFLAILCVSSLHKRSNHTTTSMFSALYREFIRLSAVQAFSRHQTLDDIRALVIGSFWLHDVSWTLVGTVVRIVTERHMHESYTHWVPSAPLLRRKRQNSYIPSARSTAGSMPTPAQEQNTDALHIAYEEARLYYLIYIADHQCSIPFRRPPMTRQHEVVRRAYEWLSNCSRANNRSDMRLVALVKLWEILHDAIDEIGSDLHAPLDELGLAFHARFESQIEIWHQAWSREFSMLDTFERSDINRQRLYAELFLHSMAFRTEEHTLPILFASQVTQDMMAEPHSAVQQACFDADRRRVVSEKAVDSAHRILGLLAADLNRLHILMGSTSYSHTMTTFSIVLLVKALKQFGNEDSQHYLRGADLRSILHSVDPALRALVAGAQCVAKEHMLVNITAGAKQSIEQIRAAFTSMHTQTYNSHLLGDCRSSRQFFAPRTSSIERQRALHESSTSNLSTQSYPIMSRAPFPALHSPFQDHEPNVLSSLEGFDLLSGQIPLSGVDLFQGFPSNSDLNVSNL